MYLLADLIVAINTKYFQAVVTGNQAGTLFQSCIFILNLRKAKAYTNLLTMRTHHRLHNDFLGVALFD